MIHLKNISQLATLEGVHQKDGRQLDPEDLSVVSQASVIYDQKILWVGPTKDVPSNYSRARTVDLSDYCLTPEIVDSHTHLVFAGDRADEYLMRLNGADYQEIARQGGGILSTMKATREASAEELYLSACERVRLIHSLGVGTIEIKSGYGLNYETEKKQAQVIHQLKQDFAPDIQIVRTFMAAHAVPKEFSSSHDYLTTVCLPLLKELAELGWIDQVDIFHEIGYFDEQDVRALAQAAQDLGLPIKTHADEFHDNNGAALASELNALSADHLLSCSSQGMQALANSSTVATLLPGTGLFLGKPQAKARELLDRGAKVALASDYNPGSCHFNNLLMLASIMAPQFKLNQAELWAAITYNASHALGLTDQGALVPGLKPRFSFFKIDRLSQITYHWGSHFAVCPSEVLKF